MMEQILSSPFFRWDPESPVTSLRSLSMARFVLELSTDPRSFYRVHIKMDINDFSCLVVKSDT